MRVISLQSSPKQEGSPEEGQAKRMDTLTSSLSSGSCSPRRSFPLGTSVRDSTTNPLSMVRFVRGPARVCKRYLASLFVSRDGGRGWGGGGIRQGRVG